MMDKDNGVPPAGSGSRKSSRKGVSPADAASIPNVKKRPYRVLAGYRRKLSRYRSVEVLRLADKRGRKSWGLIFKNRGEETRVGLSDEALLAVSHLAARVKAEDAIGARTMLMHRVEHEWRAMTPEEIVASGMSAGTAETQSGSGPQGRQPGGEAGTP